MSKKKEPVYSEKQYKSISEMTDQEFVENMDALIEPYYNEYLSSKLLQDVSISTSYSTAPSFENVYAINKTQTAAVQKTKAKKRAGIIIPSILGLIFSIVLVFAAIVLDRLAEIASYTSFVGVDNGIYNIEIFTTLFTKAQNGYVLNYLMTEGEFNFMQVAGFATIGDMVMVIFAGLLIVTFASNMFSVKTRFITLLFALLSLVGAVVFEICLYLTIEAFSIGMIVVGACAVLNLIMSAIAFATFKKNKKLIQK